MDTTPQIMVLADKNNPNALEIEKKLEHLVSKVPNMIVVIGGDGMMLHAIKKNWKRRLPFLGLNAGHRGFLLNDLSAVDSILQGNRFFASNLVIHSLPLLDVEMIDQNGKMKRAVAFNDVWVERARSQTAWIKVEVNGVTRIERLMADAVLVATPAGSTAYAMAMGATPLPLDSETLVLVASNNADFRGFKSANLPKDSLIELSSLDVKKRPLFGVVDGKRYGIIKSLKVAVSSIAVQLAFLKENSLAEKLVSVQFK